MPIIDYEATARADALWRATKNTINTAVGVKRILNNMDTIKGVTNDYAAVAAAFGCVPADASTGQAAYDAVNTMYAHLLNAHNAALVFDKLQG
jgi:hypothetical protein